MAFFILSNFGDSESSSFCNDITAAARVEAGGGDAHKPDSKGCEEVVIIAHLQHGATQSQEMLTGRGGRHSLLQYLCYRFTIWCLAIGKLRMRWLMKRRLRRV